MRKSLVKYERNPPAKYDWLIGLALVGLIVWLVFKGKSQYNEERVEIERDERGRIRAMVVHRTAH